MTANTLTVTLPHTAEAIATLQREAESDLACFRDLHVTDADEYALADELLTDVVRKKDATTAMRASATQPMYQAAKTVEAWFKPVLSALGEAEKHLKAEIGAYRVAQALAAAASRALAVNAAEANDAPALVAAITNAAAADAKPAGRATVALRWTVKRLVPELLTRETLLAFTLAHEESFRGWAEKGVSAATGEDAPVVAGVVFERTARVGAKR